MGVIPLQYLTLRIVWKLLGAMVNAASNKSLFEEEGAGAMRGVAARAEFHPGVLQSIRPHFPFFLRRSANLPTKVSGVSKYRVSPW